MDLSASWRSSSQAKGGAQVLLILCLTTWPKVQFSWLKEGSQRPRGDWWSRVPPWVLAGPQVGRPQIPSFAPHTCLNFGVRQKSSAPGMGTGFLSESVLGGQRLRHDRQRRDMDRGEGTEEVRGPRSLAVKGGTGSERGERWSRTYALS